MLRRGSGHAIVWITGKTRFWAEQGARASQGGEPLTAMLPLDRPATAIDAAGVFGSYLARWALVPDGDPIATPTSRLLPVRNQGAPAMLKVAVIDEEKVGNALMVAWHGRGAARVLAHDADAVLLERADRAPSLADLVSAGQDDKVTGIICEVVASIHGTEIAALPNLVPLERWFEELRPAASAQGGVLVRSAEAARELFASPRQVGVLHGDVHHGNVLYFGERGWLAIDPKGLLGERAFDYANLFCNPDRETATASDRFAQRVGIVSRYAGLERRRLLQWVLAWAGLSATWSAGDALPPATRLRVAELAAAELDR